MNRNKRQRDLAQICGQLNEDDGVDPRQYFKSHIQRNKNQYKTRQLCRQVAETLSLVLSGDFSDECLQNLELLSVDPAPDASQLSITVRTYEPCDFAAIAQIQERLAQVNGRLRNEVAAAITRKRVPRLIFQVISCPGDPESEVRA